MASHKAHVYVSFYHTAEDVGTRSLGKDLPHLWTILVEPHKHLLSFHHKTDEQETDFLPPTPQEADSIGLLTRQPTKSDQNQRIGKILIGHNRNTTLDEVDKILQKNMHPSEKEVPSDGYQRNWIHAAVKVLQEHQLIDVFDIGEFLIFGKAYGTEREHGQGPAAVVYPVLEGKKHSHGFWISHPSREAVPWSQRHDYPSKYGGLM